MSEQFVKLSCDIAERRDLTASDKIVYAVLQNYQGENGYSWPGIRTLAEKTGLTTVTVIGCIKRLELAGLLQVDRRGNGKSSHYCISETGKETIPVKKLNRSRNYTGTGKETIPEARKKLTPNKKDLQKTYSASGDFTFVLRSKKLWHLPQGKLNEYKGTYSSLDVEAELRNAGQWLIDNIGRRKTALGMPRYLSGWLSRAKTTQQQTKNDKPRPFTAEAEAAFFDDYIAKNAPTAEQAEKLLAEVAQ